MLKWIARKLKQKDYLPAAMIAAALHGYVDTFGVFGTIAIFFHFLLLYIKSLGDKKNAGTKSKNAGL